MKDVTGEKKQLMAEELQHSDPNQILNSVREAGMSFGHALNHVMEGFVRSDKGRVTLEDELRTFHAENAHSDFQLLPSDDYLATRAENILLMSSAS